MEFTFYGHACFKIDTGKESLLFDPFLSGNSQAAVSADKVECDYILLSHAHGDHFGDADKIASRTGACVIAIPGGTPCGFIIQFNNGKTVYYSGDTALFGDMKLFGELFDIDYAVLPIGDNYTMGPDDALIAAKFLKAKCVIPVHYSTWPVIEQNPADFKEEAQKQGIAVKIVKAGESLEL